MSDEKVIKERKFKIREENERKKRNGKGDGRENERKGKEGDAYIKMENIHFNPPGKFAFKSNSFLAIWSKIAI